jgi:hypothetical protein
MKDTIFAHCFCIPLPDVLPSQQELIHLNPNQVKKLISSYMGMPIEKIEKKLKPGQDCECGFITKSQHLSEIIIEVSLTILFMFLFCIRTQKLSLRWVLNGNKLQIDWSL